MSLLQRDKALSPRIMCAPMKMVSSRSPQLRFSQGFDEWPWPWFARGWSPQFNDHGLQKDSLLAKHLSEPNGLEYVLSLKVIGLARVRLFIET